MTLKYIRFYIRFKSFYRYIYNSMLFSHKYNNLNDLNLFNFNFKQINEFMRGMIASTCNISSILQ